MKTFKDYINLKEKHISLKERAVIIRNLLKEKYKLINRDVSVVVKNNSININLKTINALLYIKELYNIGKMHEEIYYDDQTMEILGGGNIFINVKLDNKLYNIIEEKLTKYFIDFVKKGNFSKPIFSGIYLIYDSNTNKYSILNRLNTVNYNDLLDKNKIKYLIHDIYYTVETNYLYNNDNKVWKEFLKIIK